MTKSKMTKSKMTQSKTKSRKSFAERCKQQNGSQKMKTSKGQLKNYKY